MKIKKVETPKQWGKSEVNKGMSIAESIIHTVIQKPLNDAIGRSREKHNQYPDNFISKKDQALSEEEGYPWK